MSIFSAGRDIGDRLGEDVGPFLLEQRCRLAAPFGIVVDPPRLGPLFDLGAHHTAADRHLHRADGAVLRQRKDVDDLDRFVVRIAEGLGHLDVGQKATELGFDRGVLERHALLTAALRGFGDLQLRELTGIGVHDERTAGRALDPPRLLVEWIGLVRQVEHAALATAQAAASMPGNKV